MANIPYQLVSMAAILRDYTDPKYISDEHYKLTSVADYFYNACFGDYDNDAKNLLPDYKAVYDKYGASYFEKVLDDMYALDEQVSDSRKEKELLDDYNDRIRMVSASSKVCGSKSVKASSWKDQQEGDYGSVYNIKYTPVTFSTEDGEWQLSFNAYIEETENAFWFDDDNEGGTGGTAIGAIAYLENFSRGATIRFPFDIYYMIFGNPENTDDFYLCEPDRSLDKDEGIWYNIDEVEGISQTEAEEFMEEHKDEIFDAIIKIVNDNLYQFGYEL